MHVCELAFVQGEAHRRRKPRHLLTAQRRTSQEIPHVAVRCNTFSSSNCVFITQRNSLYALPAVFHPTARCLVKLDAFKVRVWGGGGGEWAGGYGWDYATFAGSRRGVTRQPLIPDARQSSRESL